MTQMDLSKALTWCNAQSLEAIRLIKSIGAWAARCLKLFVGAAASGQFGPCLGVLVIGIVASTLYAAFANVVMLGLIKYSPAVTPATDKRGDIEIRVEDFPLNAQLILNDGMKLTPLRKYVIAHTTAEGDQSGSRTSARDERAQTLSTVVIVTNPEIKSLEMRIFFGESTNDKNEIEWWKSNGLADTPALVRFQRHPILFFFSEPKFDTSPAALGSWYRNYWHHESRLRWPSETRERQFRIKETQLNIDIAGELERLLSDDWGKANLSAEVVFLRIQNGSVQWLTVAVFFSVMLLLAFRYIVFVQSERSYTLPLVGFDPKRGPTRIWFRQEMLASELRSNSKVSEWNVPSPRLQGWMLALSGIGGNNAEDPAGIVSKFSTLTNSSITNSGSLVRTLLNTMPALGFVGTVLGMSRSMVGTGNILSEAIAKQQSRVGDVALDLAFAFDTTFVALVLTIIANIMLSATSSAEKQLVTDCEIKGVIIVQTLFRKAGLAVRKRPKPKGRR